MEPKRTAYVILGLLAIESGQSGYDIKKTIEGSVGYFWGESYGQLYPTLKRMVTEGLITVSEPEGAGKRQRLLYSITEAGRAALEIWLALPYRDDPPRNEFMLKLFFGYDAGAQMTMRQIQEFLSKNRQMLAQLELIGEISRVRHVENPQRPYWLLTLDFGIAQLRAAIAWSEMALAQLNALDVNQTKNRTTSEPLTSK
jgi:DNA-binding PadR family transcriptional regulator